MEILLHYLGCLKLSVTQFLKKHSDKIKRNYIQKLMKLVLSIKKKKSKLHMFFFQNPNFSLSSEIQSIIKLVLVLSHDQASVQHEFNINKIS